MNRVLHYMVGCLLLSHGCSPAFADEPPKVEEELSVIVAPKDVTGTGKKSDPFVFDSTTNCLLKLTGKAAGVVWDTDDCPPGFEVLDNKYLSFNLKTSGLFTTTAHGGSVYSKCWFEIKGPNGPPPVPPPANELAVKLRASLVGPDAKADAAKLGGMAAATADALERGSYPTKKELNAAWKAGQAVTEWPANKYAGMPEIIRLVVTPENETTPIDATMRTAFIAGFRLIAKTAGDIEHGR